MIYNSYNVNLIWFIKNIVDQSINLKVNERYEVLVSYIHDNFAIKLRLLCVKWMTLSIMKT